MRKAGRTRTAFPDAEIRGHEAGQGRSDVKVIVKVSLCTGAFQMLINTQTNPRAVGGLMLRDGHESRLMFNVYIYVYIF